MFEKLRRRKNIERTLCGYNWAEMDNSLKDILGLEDDSIITEKEEKALNIAIICMTQIMNRMLDGKRIFWD